MIMLCHKSYMQHQQMQEDSGHLAEIPQNNHMETKNNQRCIIYIGMIILQHGYTVKPLSQDTLK